MDVTEYLLPAAGGAETPWHVPDLVPTAAAELVLVFESPHVEELKARIPVAGAAGRSALRYLLPAQPKNLSLGHFVDQSLQAAHGRVAILNVSNVPMQAAAFVNSKAPDLSGHEWALLERVRTSTARSISAMRGSEAKALTEHLAERLQGRLSKITVAENCVVVAAGMFAQRVTAAAATHLPSFDLLDVPHPSFNQWHRKANEDLPNLQEVRRRFRDCCANGDV